VADAPARLRIQETFVSLQGEGALVGVPSRFIRVSGCNLRCTWCDSPDSSWAPKGAFESLDALVDLCAEGPRHVVLTGGEPMLFAGIAELSRRLAAAGHHITVESAGTVWLDDLHCDLISISPKLSHSTPHQRAPEWVERHEAARWAPEVVARLIDAYPEHQLKFVMRWRDADALEADLGEIDAMLHDLAQRGLGPLRVMLMPECTDRLELGRAYAALLPLCTERDWRLGERLHIHLFGDRPGT
jgi:7-carboxy-7-deazaguanine synthase